MTSHMVCITNGDFRAIPPMPITLSMTTPSSSNLSTIAFVPKAVASTRARNTCGAVVPRVKPATVPLSSWFASGVRRPLIQSVAIIVLSLTGIFSASSVSLTIILSHVSSTIWSTSSLLSLPPSVCGSMFLTGNSSMRLNIAYTSPKLDWPASRPTIPGITLPSTWPQIPLMHFVPISSYDATITSHVDVPITLTRVCVVTPAPTAPMWQSYAPPATTTFSLRPSLCAHSLHRWPTGLSAVSVSVKSLSRNPASFWSIDVRNSSDGSPPHSLCHMALCPHAQRLRTMSLADFTPVSTAGSHSQYSTIEYAFLAMAWSSRSIWSAFAQNHSAEYIPPSYLA